MGFFHLATVVRNEFLTNLRDRLNGGALELYAGDVPASADVPLFGQLFRVRLEFPDPCALDPDGMLTLTVIDGIAADGDPPTFGRLYDEDENTVGDIDVGPMESTASLRFDALNFVQGNTVRVTSAVLR